MTTKLQRQSQSMGNVMARMVPQIAKALPKHVTPERMSRLALTAFSSNPKLQQCSQESFLGAVMQCAQLGLEPNTPLGHAYLIPYGQQCQLIIGYQGMLDLARRSGHISAIYGHVVKQGDEFSYELGLEPKLKHVPSEDPARSSKPMTHVYAVARLKSGEPVFTVLSLAEVKATQARSKSGNSGPWKTDFDAMALKTAVRRLFKWMPKSTEQVRAEVLETPVGAPQAFSPEVTEVLETSGVAGELPPAEIKAEPEERMREPGED